MAKNEERGKLVAGASTISQQLAKNLFLSGERSWIRKAEEAAITWMLEHTLSKRRILELYLNVAEWGDGGVFGVEAAARYHFGVPASALSQDFFFSSRRRHTRSVSAFLLNRSSDLASGVVDIFHGIDKAVADTWNNFWKDGKADGIGSNLSRK